MKHPIVTRDGVLRMHKSELTTRDLKSFSTASRLQRTSGEQMMERSTGSLWCANVFTLRLNGKAHKRKGRRERNVQSTYCMRALYGLGKGPLPLCLISFLFPDFRHYYKYYY